ncbi:MAG: potassium-transporting ATPase subunit KdpC [Alphaproteobacteria bacterium]|nr:potassium-transporting ATPase subunit KdpC [Alphaproteobacteria bacterium]
MLTHLRSGLVLLVVLTVLTGGVYPLAVTVIAETAFSSQAHGSLIERDGRTVGSALIGQRFTGPGWFHPRPSAAGSDGYDAASSGASNLAPSGKALRDAVAGRVARLSADNPRAGRAIPVDLVTASASGLDPHISVAAAEYQSPRVAQARGLAESDLRRLITAHVEERPPGFLNEPNVNVLLLNLALDARYPLTNRALKDH